MTWDCDFRKMFSGIITVSKKNDFLSHTASSSIRNKICLNYAIPWDIVSSSLSTKGKKYEETAQ